MNGRIVAYDLGEPAPLSERTSEWLGSQGGAARSGPVGAPQSVAIAGIAAPSATEVFFYPNPLRDDTVTLRYYAGADGPVRFTLHTLEGAEVLGGEYTAVGGLVNEISLDVPAIARSIRPPKEPKPRP